MQRNRQQFQSAKRKAPSTDPPNFALKNIKHPHTYRHRKAKAYKTSLSNKDPEMRRLSPQWPLESE